MRASEVFPEALGPRTAQCWPDSIVHSTPRSISTPSRRKDPTSMRATGNGPSTHVSVQRNGITGFCYVSGIYLQTRLASSLASNAGEAPRPDITCGIAPSAAPSCPSRKGATMDLGKLQGAVDQVDREIDVLGRSAPGEASA